VSTMSLACCSDGAVRIFAIEAARIGKAVRHGGDAWPMENLPRASVGGGRAKLSITRVGYRSTSC
jgi:hypothetical protein